LNVVISGCKDNGHAVVNADDLNSFLPLQGYVDPTELSTLVSGDKVSQQKKTGHFFVRAVFATSSNPTVHVLAMTTKRSCFMSMPWKETPKISSLSSFFIEASHHFPLSHFSAIFPPVTVGQTCLPCQSFKQGAKQRTPSVTICCKTGFLPAR